MKKHVLFLVALLISGQMTAITAPAWVQNTRQKIERAFGGASQNVRSYVNAKGGCFFSGTCSPAVMAELKAIALKVGVSIGALVTTMAITGGTYYIAKKLGRSDDSDSIELVEISSHPMPTQSPLPEEKFETTYTASDKHFEKKPVEFFANLYGLPPVKVDDSFHSMLINGVRMGSLEQAKRFKDFIEDKRYLEMARDIAQQESELTSSQAERKNFNQIVITLNSAIKNFRPERDIKSRIGFVRSALTGLLDEVEKRVCIDRDVERLTIAEAIKQLKGIFRIRKDQQQVLHFLVKPVCKKGR